MFTNRLTMPCLKFVFCVNNDNYINESVMRFKRLSLTLFCLVQGVTFSEMACAK